MSDFERAIALEPDDPMAYLGRGTIRLDRRDFLEAIADLVNVVNLDPRLAQGYRNLGYALYAVGKFEEAETNFSTALKIAPRFRSEIDQTRALIDKMRAESPKPVKLN